jgi:hypothetical protein
MGLAVAYSDIIAVNEYGEGFVVDYSFNFAASAFLYMVQLAFMAVVSEPFAA